MTDKEFKRLSRSQLIDIIYELQLKQEELAAENERLSKALADKRLRISQVGNLAEAALEIHNVMQAAQEAAEHYLEEVRLRADNEEQLILSEAKEKAAAIPVKAEKEAAMLTVHPKERENEYDSVIDTILNKYRRDE